MSCWWRPLWQCHKACPALMLVMAQGVASVPTDGAVTRGGGRLKLSVPLDSDVTEEEVGRGYQFHLMAM